MVKNRVAGVLALFALAVPAFTHAAGNCSSDVSILSRNSTAADQPAVNPHELVVCPAGGDPSGADTRVIQPGADQIQVVYAPTPPPALGTTLTATLGGLVNGTTVLVARRNLAGLIRYESDWLPIQRGASGTITATVPGDGTTYHTVN